MNFRRALAADLGAAAALYDAVHTMEESGRQFIGWVRGVYPTEKTAGDAITRGDLFLLEDQGILAGSAIINRIQVPAYEQGHWEYAADGSEVMVLHTLVINPELTGRGYAKAFAAFYEKYALENGCRFLRMDTNAGNTAARTLYQSLGYREADIVPTVFNGIEGVQLVLLEKKIGPDYELMTQQLAALADTDPFYVPLLANASALLWEHLPQINWGGFYLVRGAQLVLGPFQGKTACIHIAKGKGVCGTAWEKDETQAVPDVHQFPGHIACDDASRSEIVIPLHVKGKTVGVMDIDSPLAGRFTKADQKGLEQFALQLERKMNF